MRRAFLFFVMAFSFQFMTAQYCGNSGPSICTPNTAITVPGLFPLSPQLPPFINGQAADTVIEFKNFDTVYFNGNAYVIQTLQIDTISNLPTGLCWAMDQASNTYSNQQNGCIRVSGTPCAPPGQYKLNIIVTVDVGFTVTVNADYANLYYFIRVDNQGEAATPVDTTQTSSNPFISYNSLSAICPTPPLTVSLGGNQLVCNGSIITLKPIITNGLPPYTFSWQSTGDTLSCDTCKQPTTTLTQTSTFILTVTDANDSIVRDTVTYTVSGSGINFHINAGGATTFCQGDSVTLTGTGNALTYQWTVGGSNISNATDTTYTVASTGGSYQLNYTEPGGCHATSNAIQVTIHPLPYVLLQVNPDTLCVNSATVSLVGNPPGGTFSGPGVSNGVFTPNSSLLGSNSLTYTYTDANSCTNTSTATAVVEACTGISDPVLENSTKLYPNPVNDELTVQSNFFIANNVTVAIYDITGKLITASCIREHDKLIFNTATITPGLYWIRLKINGSELSRKFVKM